MQLYIHPDTWGKPAAEFQIVNEKQEMQYKITPHNAAMRHDLLFEDKDKKISYCIRGFAKLIDLDYALYERTKFHGKYTFFFMIERIYVHRSIKGALSFSTSNRLQACKLEGKAGDHEYKLHYNDKLLGEIKKGKIKSKEMAMDVISKEKVTEKVTEKDLKTGEEKQSEKTVEKTTEKEVEKEVEADFFVLETAEDGDMPFFAAAVAFIHFAGKGSFA